MSKISNKNDKSIDDHKKYLSRITKTLHYGKLPRTETLSFPVTEFAADLFSQSQKGKSIARLHFCDAARIVRNACVSPCSMVLAMLYLERLKTCNPNYIEKISPSDLFLVSLMVSCKFLFDDGESDEVYLDEWAASGGITVKELVNLEKDFLTAIDWEIYVSELTFWKKMNDLEVTLALKQGTSRGYFTYTELNNIFMAIEIQDIVQSIIAVSIILAATYTAGLLSIMGSIFLVSHVPGTSLYMKKLNACENMTLPSVEYITNTRKTDFNSKCIAVNMLKTSILLTSIKTNCTAESEVNNPQYMTWDYWNIPIMNWLTETSRLILSYAQEFPLKYTQQIHLDASVTNLKCIELEDHIHKGTKTRIQDQMESSWHKEWTSSIKGQSCYLFTTLKQI